MKYYCTPINDDQRDDWEYLVRRNVASGFQQSFAWMKLKEAQKRTTYHIGLFRSTDDVLVGGCCVVEMSYEAGMNFLYIPQGPVLDYSDTDSLFWQWRALETAIHGLVSMTREMQTTHIRIEPMIAAVPEGFLTGFHKSGYNLQPRATRIVSLIPSEEEILAQMKPKGRYNIRLSAKKGVQVQEIPLSDVGLFYDLYKTTFERDCFDGWDLDFFQKLCKTCGSFMKLFIAHKDGISLAGGIMIYFGNRATYLYGASSDDSRHLKAPCLLNWHMMRLAKQWGYREYDFWGIAWDETDTTHSWHGLTTFKQQFGGERHEYIGAYDYVVQNDLYQAFVERYES